MWECTLMSWNHAFSQQLHTLYLLSNIPTIYTKRSIYWLARLVKWVLLLSVLKFVSVIKMLPWAAAKKDGTVLHVFTLHMYGWFRRSLETSRSLSERTFFQITNGRFNEVFSHITATLFAVDTYNVQYLKTILVHVHHSYVPGYHQVCKTSQPIDCVFTPTFHTSVLAQMVW